MNRLLSTAPRTEINPRFPGLVAVRLAFGQVLQEAGERVQHVYFPTDAVVSLLTARAQDRAPVEVGMIGREGMVGVSLALGATEPWARAQVQGAGQAMRASAAQFLSEFRRSTRLRRDVYRYSYELTAQMMQTAACNRNHSPEQRLARWLLMMRDRSPSDRLELTQRFLGYMVGMRRAGVSEAAAGLQSRSLIRWRRGSIDILDRRGLEVAACPCYGLLKPQA